MDSIDALNMKPRRRKLSTVSILLSIPFQAKKGNRLSIGDPWTLLKPCT